MSSIDARTLQNRITGINLAASCFRGLAASNQDTDRIHNDRNTPLFKRRLRKSYKKTILPCGGLVSSVELFRRQNGNSRCTTFNVSCLVQTRLNQYRSWPSLRLQKRKCEILSGLSFVFGGTIPPT